MLNSVLLLASYDICSVARLSLPTGLASASNPIKHIQRILKQDINTLNNAREVRMQSFCHQFHIRSIIVFGTCNKQVKPRPATGTPVGTDELFEMYHWLEELKLTQYTSTFKANGFVSTKLLPKLNRRALQGMAITLPTHQLLLMRAPTGVSGSGWGSTCLLHVPNMMLERR